MVLLYSNPYSVYSLVEFYFIYEPYVFSVFVSPEVTALKIYITRKFLTNAKTFTVSSFARMNPGWIDLHDKKRCSHET